MELEIELIKNFVEKLKGRKKICPSRLGTVERKILYIFDQYFIVSKYLNGEYAISEHQINNLKDYEFFAKELRLVFEGKKPKPDIEKQIIDVFKGLDERFTMDELEGKFLRFISCNLKYEGGKYKNNFTNPFKEKAEEIQSPLKVGNDHLNETQKDLVKKEGSIVLNIYHSPNLKVSTEPSNQKPSELFCKGGWDWLSHANPNEKIIDAIQVQHSIDLLKSKGYKITKTTEL